jgi:hypothetical protein
MASKVVLRVHGPVTGVAVSLPFFLARMRSLFISCCLLSYSVACCMALGCFCSFGPVSGIGSWVMSTHGAV